MELLVVGSIAYDSIETPAGKADNVLGGSATYFSLCASLFTSVRIIGIVGEDFRDEDKKLFESRGINTDGLETAAGKTFRWKGDYLKDLNEAMTHETHLNVFEHFHPKVPVSYRGITHIFLANIDPVLQSEVLDQMHNPAFIACDTMNYWINTRNRELKSLLKRVNLIVFNEAEVKALTGERNIYKGAKTILSWGPGYVIIKRGEYGSVLIAENECYIIPAFPVENVVDPTGAGDSFAGGFMGDLARSGKVNRASLRKAMRYGSVMSSFTVEDFSLERLKNLDFGEIENRYKEFGNIIH